MVQIWMSWDHTVRDGFDDLPAAGVTLAPTAIHEGNGMEYTSSSLIGLG